MLRVDARPTPASFYKTVTIQGRQYLRDHSDANGRVLPALWNKCRQCVYERYQGMCAYLGIKILECSGYEVDHYQPKSKHIQLAFEWSNLRLACPHVNRLKGAKDVCDPFGIPIGSLSINFLTGRVSVEQAKAGGMDVLLKETVRILQLNEGSAREPRLEAFSLYKRHDITVRQLANRYPFAAFEMLRQHRLQKDDIPDCIAELTRLGYATAVQSVIG